MQDGRDGQGAGRAVGLVVAGGVVAAIAAFLPWAKATAPGVGTSWVGNGWAGWEGKLVVALSVGMIVRAFLASGRGSGARKGLAILVIIGGAIVAGVALYDIFTFKAQVLGGAAAEMSTQNGTTPEQARALLQSLLNSGALTLSLQFGIFVVVLGGVTGIAGGLMLALQPAAAPAPFWLASPAAAGPSPWGSGGGSGWTDPAWPAPPSLTPPPPAPSVPAASAPSTPDQLNDPDAPMWSTISVPSRSAPPQPSAAPAPERPGA